MVLYRPSDRVLFWSIQYTAARLVSSCHLPVQKLSLAPQCRQDLMLSPCAQHSKPFNSWLICFFNSPPPPLFYKYEFSNWFTLYPLNTYCALPTHCLFHTIPRIHMAVRIFTSSLHAQFKCPSFQTFLIIIAPCELLISRIPIPLIHFCLLSFLSYLFNQLVAEATIIYSLASS